MEGLGGIGPKTELLKDKERKWLASIDSNRGPSMKMSSLSTQTG